MNFLLDNPLANMYGPYFLVLYGFVVLFTIVMLAFMRSVADESLKMPSPQIPTVPDPFEIAYLRGGKNEMARSVIFSLLNKNLIEIKSDTDSSVVKPVQFGAQVNGLSNIENLTLRWIGGGREAKEVFDSSYGLVEQLDSHGNVYRQRLEAQQMLTGEQTESRLVIWKRAAILLIVGLGGYKLSVALWAGYSNVFLLLVFGVVGLLIANAVSKIPRISKLGTAYLERLQLVFSDLKYTSQAGRLKNDIPQTTAQTPFSSVDPLLLSVGIFGGSILAGTMYENYNEAFVRAQNQSGGSGCGSSCGSSCSSGDGGGGCGGGCGGCGGGD